MRRECPKNRAVQGPWLCPGCRKGHHWGNECRSKLDIEGCPLSAGKPAEGPTPGPPNQSVQSNESGYLEPDLFHSSEQPL